MAGAEIIPFATTQVHIRTHVSVNQALTLRQTTAEAASPMVLISLVYLFF